MRALYYDKDGKPITDTLEWAKKFEDREYRKVGYTKLTNTVLVSTVWLGLDHDFLEEGAPIIFETMVFVDGTCTDQKRYSTLEQAKEGHRKLVKEYRGNIENCFINIMKKFPKLEDARTTKMRSRYYNCGGCGRTYESTTGKRIENYYKS